MLQDEASLKLDHLSHFYRFKITFALNSLSLKGRIGHRSITISPISMAPVRIWKKSRLPWEINAPENHLCSRFKRLYSHARATKNQALFPLTYNYGFLEANLIAARTKAEIQMNFDGMPTSLLSSPLTAHDLSPIIGPVIDLNLKTFIDPTQEKPGYGTCPWIAPICMFKAASN